MKEDLVVIQFQTPSIIIIGCTFFKICHHLEGNLISVRHFCVWQDGHHPLLVIDRLWWRHREGQPLVFQQVTAIFFYSALLHLVLWLSPYVRIVANKILQTVKLSASNVIIPTHRSNSKIKIIW